MAKLNATETINRWTTFCKAVATDFSIRFFPGIWTKAAALWSFFFPIKFQSLSFPLEVICVVSIASTHKKSIQLVVLFESNMCFFLFNKLLCMQYATLILLFNFVKALI